LHTLLDLDYLSLVASFTISAARATQTFEMTDTGPSTDLQTDDPGAAKEETHWWPILDKTRENAYQHVKSYRISQQGHIQVDEEEPLSTLPEFSTLSIITNL
jgi:hypothetical protein